jgi:hypothetical protein
VLLSGKTSCSLLVRNRGANFIEILKAIYSAPQMLRSEIPAYSANHVETFL